MERAQRDEFFVEHDKSHKRRRDDQDPPPPPPDSDLSKKKRHDSCASGSSQPPASQSSVWKTSNTRDAPSSSSKQQSGPHSKQPVKDIPMPETANIYDSEDTGSAHLPKITLRPEWFKPIPEEYRPIFEGQAYEVVKAFYPNIVHLQFQMEEYHKMLTNQNDWTNLEGDKVRIDINRPLPLSGPPGHVTIQTQFFFNKDLDYLRYGNKGREPALSISKMKSARYHDFGLELLVPEHMWINDVCTYDVSASYGISYWCFNRQKFYIDRHTADSSRKVVRTHMRILSVVSTKAYSHYGYDYLKEITLRRANYQEYRIAEKDFKNLYPSDFEDLNLLLLQGHLNHLPSSDKRMLSTAVNLWTRNLVIRQRVEDFQLGIESYQKQLNLTKPGWDATCFEYKHDYTIIESHRVVVFPVSNNERKIMMFNEIYKFSDGTLTNILEALDYRVKEYKVNQFNPEHPSDTYVFTMKMEILLEPTSNKLMVQVKMEMEIPRSSGVNFITTCSYSTDTSKDLMKAQVYVSKLPQL
ncbi:hypothetical protein Tco_1383289 [Tanacetum coccineum]